jgi:transposase
MVKRNDIVLAVDYHDEKLVIRWFDCATGEEKLLKRQTSRRAIREVVRSAAKEVAPRGGTVWWIMESTTGWVRVKEVVKPPAEFVVANVLQMPLPPKGRRRKTDKIDTRRLLREVLNGRLPTAFEPNRGLREVRRLVSLRESLVSRRTALRNWVNRYLAHETWCSRRGLWSRAGVRQLRAFAAGQSGLDRLTLTVKLDEVEHVEKLIQRTEKAIGEVYRQWPEAQRVQEIYGIGQVAAVSILARIGPVERFANAEELISYAGLAPGVRESMDSRRDGHVGGGGTDKHLRHYLIEASVWARRIPRYRPTYERALARRGKKIARLVVSRLLLRSIEKMLRTGVRFNAAPAA